MPKFKVVSNCRVNGESVKEGDILDLDATLGLHLRAAQRVVPYDEADDAPAPAEETKPAPKKATKKKGLTTESASALVSGGSDGADN